MQYMGSKSRVAKHILPIMLENRNGRTWVEPFVGGANMIDKVDGKRIGADNNKQVIDALVMIRDYPKDLPKSNLEYTEKDYNRAKNSDFSNPIDCFAMFTYSFGYKFRGGWSRAKDGKDYVGIAYRVAQKQSPKLKDIDFVHRCYQELEVPDNSLIYCDPPYEGTTKYKGGFDHSEFWEWCRIKAKEGHQVFISEYNAPNDFKEVWSKESYTNFDSNRKTKDVRVEKLFMYCG